MASGIGHTVWNLIIPWIYRSTVSSVEDFDDCALVFLAVRRDLGFQGFHGFLVPVLPPSMPQVNLCVASET